MAPYRTRLAGAVLFLVASLGQPLRAQKDTIDVVTAAFWTWRDVAILEAFAISAVALAPLDTRFAERLQNPRVQENRSMRRIAVIVENITDPGAVIIGVGMYAYGRLSKNYRAADLGLHGTEALFIGAGTGYLLKGIFGRARPYKDITRPHDYRLFRGFRGSTDFRSFPSGHSIAAFSAAAAVQSETKLWWPSSVWVIGPLMYGGAAAVAWSRMFDNKHWASDVITGAAIGTFTGLKVVHWHHKHPNNPFDRFLLGAVVARGESGGSSVRLFAMPALR